MHKSDEKYQAYVKILEEELVPAMGCTEPIAIAYAGAVARKTLGNLPEQLDIKVSGNIIKNVKSVIVPNTGGKPAVRQAAQAGDRACAGYQPQAAAARRACRGHEPERDRGADGDDRNRPQEVRRNRSAHRA